MSCQEKINAFYAAINDGDADLALEIFDSNHISYPLTEYMHESSYVKASNPTMWAVFVRILQKYCLEEAAA